MIVNFLLGLVGIILFLFVFWKRLKEDYSSDIIFQTATGILIGLSFGLIVSRLFLPDWFFWMSLVGAIFGMFLMLSKFKLRLYETLEALILAGMPIVSLMFFKNAITHSSLNSFLAFVISLVLIFFAYLLDLNYKSFSWYKSGRIGFAGLATAAVFFLARTVVAILGITVISCVNKYEAVVSGVFALTCIGLLINLGKEKK